MLFPFPAFLILKLGIMKHLKERMYPKVKVREQNEGADQYDYGKSSLQSLKAFEWLSLDHASPSCDDSPQSVVRIPGSYVPTSPSPCLIPSKEETNKKKWTIWGKNQKSVRATLAPRVRAVLSSPENDRISRSKTQTRRELLSDLKSHNSCQNRHTKCKFSTTHSAEVFGPNNKGSIECKNDMRTKEGKSLGNRIG
ncbi:hypothetical protein CDL12_27298 [Handroanthus impetiginosus]|uniref:Uncharacterized protein n=1 Tax=Handroanthus impetiginosus TaxID=429701 RepID=A0A2G9G4F4_9LAMI|nr:hypothetical protein CDL12_27298 [Handroanthus impetiginosus]